MFLILYTVKIISERCELLSKRMNIFFFHIGGGGGISERNVETEE